MGNYLSFDIGGTFIKYGILDEKANEIFSDKVSTQKEPKKFLAQLIDIVKTQEKVYKINGVTISMGGFIDPKTGINTDFSVGENFRAYNLKEELNKSTGYRISVENDSNCAALAEMWKGSGVECKDICVITIGTGIGGAIISDGKLLRGRNFKAGEFGFMYVNSSNQEGKEVFEAATATSGLVRQVRSKLGKDIDGKYIFKNLDNCDIKEIYDRWLTKLAMVVGNVAVCFDPEKILIGGGISEEAIFINDLREKVYSVYQHLQEYTAIEPCSLKNDAGKIGALFNFFMEYES